MIFAFSCCVHVADMPNLWHYFGTRRFRVPKPQKNDYIMAAASIKEPVKIRRKNLVNGNVSLYLAIYIHGHREYEFLKLYLIPEKTKADKERNKHTLALANSIKAKRIVEIQNGEYGFKNARKERTLFYDYFEALAEKRKKEDSKATFACWMSCLRHMKKYDPRQTLAITDITTKWVQGFRDYLEKTAVIFGCKNAVRKGRRPLSQNTRDLYFNKLRACLKQACEDGLISSNPSRDVLRFRRRDVTRGYLTIEQVKAMAAADCDFPEIRRAFLFSCLTGLRRSDITKLVWGEVTRLDGRTRLVFRQKKTGGQEYLDITPQAAELIGERGDAKPDDRVFGDIRVSRYTNECLRMWALRAGIDRPITFHIVRHTLYFPKTMTITI